MQQDQISDLRVTSRTAGFVSALNLLDQTQEQFFQALSTLYGEESGRNFYNEKESAFDSARNAISEFLTISIVTSLNDRRLKDTI